MKINRFEKELAAEALRINENDAQKALDDLTNPETNSAIQVLFAFLHEMILAADFVSSIMLTFINLQLDIESRKRKRQCQATESAIEELTSMGFERSEGIYYILTS